MIPTSIWSQWIHINGSLLGSGQISSVANGRSREHDHARYQQPAEPVAPASIKRLSRRRKCFAHDDAPLIGWTFGNDAAVWVNHHRKLADRAQSKSDLIFGRSKDTIGGMVGREPGGAAEIIIHRHQYNLRAAVGQFAGNKQSMPIPTDAEPNLPIRGLFAL